MKNLRAFWGIREYEEGMMDQFRKWQEDRILAHVVPLAVILLFGLIGGNVIGYMDFFRDHSDLPWWRRQPEYWMLGLEVVLGTASLAFFWKHYELRWSKWVWFGALMGAVGIGFWILPTQIYEWMGLDHDPEGWLKRLGVQSRIEGFDGLLFEKGSGLYWGAVVVRFWRAVILVSLAEEIFWRSFLMRFLLDRDGPNARFWKIPFGKASWMTFIVVTLLFTLAHAPVDYLGALIYGSLTYAVTIITRSLLSVVVMHSVANLLMGIYALGFEKYGLW